MGFVRVRSANGPAHEFDVSEEAVAADPDVFVVLDKKPVAVPRPVKYVAAVKPAAKGKE